MAETPRIPAQKIDAARTPQAAPKSTARATSPAFEALLERLTSRAADLEQKTQALDSPAALPGAVDAARASLEDALTLGEKLLEAYRAARQGDGATDAGASAGEDGTREVKP